jgi:O-antigen ligase
MTALSSPSSAPSRIDRRAIWIGLSVVLGAIIGLATGDGQTTLAVLVVLAPLIIITLIRLQWFPVLVLASAFGEALSVGGLSLSRAIGPVAVLALILGLAGRSRVSVRQVALPLTIFFYTCWAIASATWTINPVSGFGETGTGYADAQLLLSIALMLPLVMFLRTEADLRRALKWIWLLAVITGLVSIAQFASGASRSVGASGDANFFAALQVVVLPLCALLVIETKRTRDRAIVLVGVGIIVGSVITTLSRGGILALVAVFLLLSFQPAKGFFRTRARKRAFLSVVLVGGLVLLAVAFKALSARTSGLFSGQDTGSGRTNLWRAALVAWHWHEIHGIGFGAFIGQSNQLLLQTPGVNFGAYNLRSSGQYVHNAYLESLTELGVIGLVLFLAILVAIFSSLRRSARETRTTLPFTSAFARALMLGLAGFALTSIFLSAETDRTLYTLIGFALALPRVIAEERRGRDTANGLPLSLPPQRLATDV